jgi:hypothetical protein
MTSTTTLPHNTHPPPCLRHHIPPHFFFLILYSLFATSVAAAAVQRCSSQPETFRSPCPPFISSPSFPRLWPPFLSSQMLYSTLHHLHQQPLFLSCSLRPQLLYSHPLPASVKRNCNNWQLFVASLRLHS